MLTAVSSGSVLANVTPLDSGATDANSGGSAREGRQPARASVNASSLRKGRQYSVKTFISLGAALLCVTIGCREKPIDQGALITARTVGLDDLQRGRLAEAEQEFRRVIALAPRDPLGYANLGLTYLRAGRYGDAESQLQRARQLDSSNVDVGLALAKLYALTNRTEEARKLLTLFSDPRALYGLAELERESGGSAQRRYAERLRQVRGRALAPAAKAGIRSPGGTREGGWPDFGGGPAPTALALGDYDGDGEDNLLIAWPPANVRLYTLRKGFVADAGDRITLPLPAGAVSATFADYDNDGWLELFLLGTDGRGNLLHNLAWRRFRDGTDPAHVRDVD